MDLNSKKICEELENCGNEKVGEKIAGKNKIIQLYIV